MRAQRRTPANRQAGRHLFAALAVATLAAPGCSPGVPEKSGEPVDEVILPGIDGLDPQAALEKVAGRIAWFATSLARSEGRPDVSPADIEQAVGVFGPGYELNGVLIEASGAGVRISAPVLLDHHGNPVGEAGTDPDHDHAGHDDGSHDHASAPDPVHVCPGLSDDPAALVTAVPCPD